MELFNLKFWLKNIIKFSGGIVLLLIFTFIFMYINRNSLKIKIKELLERLKIVDFAIASAILLVSFYALYFWGWFRPWYYLSVVLVVTICLGIAAGHIFSSAVHTDSEIYRKPAHVILVTLILASYFSFQGFFVWEKGLFPFQSQLYESAEWLRDHTEEDSRIAAISAGIYGYFTQRTIDLAGVVNEEAYRAMREKRIFPYLQEKNIDYLVDREDMIQFYSNRFDSVGFIDKLTLIKRFGDKPSDVVVYEINATN